MGDKRSNYPGKYRLNDYENFVRKRIVFDIYWHCLIVGQCRNLRTAVMRGFNGFDKKTSKIVQDVPKSIYLLL